MTCKGMRLAADKMQLALHLWSEHIVDRIGRLLMDRSDKLLMDRSHKLLKVNMHQMQYLKLASMHPDRVSADPPDTDWCLGLRANPTTHRSIDWQ